MKQINKPNITRTICNGQQGWASESDEQGYAFFKSDTGTEFTTGHVTVLPPSDRGAPRRYKVRGGV